MVLFSRLPLHYRESSFCSHRRCIYKNKHSFLLYVQFKLLKSDSEYWTQDAQTRLLQRIATPLIETKAKNILFYLGDGMSLPTISAARILKGQKVDKYEFGEEAELHMESFPFTGTSKVIQKYIA